MAAPAARARKRARAPSWRDTLFVWSGRLEAAAGGLAWRGAWCARAPRAPHPSAAALAASAATFEGAAAFGGAAPLALRALAGATLRLDTTYLLDNGGGPAAFADGAHEVAFARDDAEEAGAAGGAGAGAGGGEGAAAAPAGGEGGGEGAAAAPAASEGAAAAAATRSASAPDDSAAAAAAPDGAAAAAAPPPPLAAAAVGRNEFGAFVSFGHVRAGADGALTLVLARRYLEAGDARARGGGGAARALAACRALVATPGPGDEWERALPV